MAPHIQETTDPRTALASIAGDFFGPDITDAPILCAGNEVPVPFNQLLVHEEHMTTRLGAYHGEPVALEVLEDGLAGDTYRRKILLTVGGAHVVEVGVVRIHLNFTAEDVRKEILSKKTPLGDILIRHNVLRRIEPKWYFRFDGPAALASAFDRELDGPIYGRVGVIHCDGEPAIELLEVVAGDRIG
jgi:chorismate-pyruvate lyase